MNSEFEELKSISGLLSQGEEDLARSRVIELLDNGTINDSEQKSLWMSVIESVGLYPYVDQSDDAETFQEKLNVSMYSSNNLNGKILHSGQFEVLEKLRNKNVVLSAPTSFGKSLLIQELVASGSYKNILILQPTLALLDETRTEIQRLNKRQKLIFNTKQEVDPEGNIFLFTAERIMEFDSFESIDLFIVDEFYKVGSSVSDDRMPTLNNAISRILNNFNPRFYFLAPKLKGVSNEFLKKYDAEFLNYSMETVNKKIVNINVKPSQKKEELFHLLDGLQESTLVYTKSPKQAIKLATEYCNHLNIDEYQKLDLSEWIDENISSQWSLKTLIGRGIGVHSGQIPRHILSTEIDYFNSGILRVLFVTSTIIEGVNTAAKNVVVFDMLKGNRKITDFDLSNIAGRAGRMMKHLSGDVYIFSPREVVSENMEVDIPFVEQGEKLDDEILINLPSKNVKESYKERYSELIESVGNYLDIVKKNSVNPEKFMVAVDLLTQRLLLWIQQDKIDLTGFTYNQIQELLGIVGSELSGLSLKYVNLLFYRSWKLAMNKNATIRGLINEEIQKRKALDNSDRDIIVQDVIQEILVFQRKYYEYEIPKLAGLIESVVRRYSDIHKVELPSLDKWIATMSMGPGGESSALLIESGMPASGVNKMIANVPKLKQMGPDDAFLFVRENKDLFYHVLSGYEMYKLRKI
ncbi:hypothetical protein D0504_04375 [Weissella confusa]|uniref:DEAD/DEAH box helicase family protein n=1 Tax=Weissella confusa TaxID=1583 RepID=UPI0021C1B5F6|nr:DEAD/DEAH box helicase family protein [Weissella confusa]MCT8392973.1 hypothetical protein [Weissella confusa]